MDQSKVVKRYSDLIVWQKAMDLAEVVYAATQKWPKDEMYGLTAQVRRAAVSVPSNIAEGQGRQSTKEFVHHVRIARGSLLEVETQVLLAQRFGYMEAEAVRGVLRAYPKNLVYWKHEQINSSKATANTDADAE